MPFFTTPTVVTTFTAFTIFTGQLGMEVDATLVQLAIALGLGLLVGLQREITEDSMAGLRTFALITLLGCILALLDQRFESWIMTGAGLLTLAGSLAMANVARWKNGDFFPGMTTEIAALLMFTVGAMVGAGLRLPAVVLGGVVAVLLHFKKALHGFVDRIGDKETKGVFQLVLIALVILPILPNQTFGPYDVWNPSNIWRMVVLIAGISLMAFLVHRWLGATRGSVIGGILGGLISSTATTVSYSRQAKDQTAWAATLVLIIASTIVNFRVLFELGVVNRELLKVAVWPIATIAGLMIALCLFAFFMARKQDAGVETDYDNPAQIKAAILFGALYALVLLAVAAVREHFGEQGLYLVALISGLTDVDAITLSTAKLQGAGSVSADTSWRVIVTALTANLVFKTGTVAVLGTRGLLKRTGTLFVAAILASVAVILLWP